MGTCFGRHVLTEAELQKKILVIDTHDLPNADEINKPTGQATSRSYDDIEPSMTPYEDDEDDSDTVELKLAASQD
jgi:hypothetical protein